MAKEKSGASNVNILIEFFIVNNPDRLINVQENPFNVFEDGRDVDGDVVLGEEIRHGDVEDGQHADLDRVQPVASKQ